MKAERQSIISNHRIMLDNIFRNCFCYEGDEGRLPSKVSTSCSAFKALMVLGLKDSLVLFILFSFFFFKKKKKGKSAKHGGWFGSDLRTKHVVENRLLGFREAENQFSSYKGACYLWCAYLLPMSVPHFCGLLVKDIIFFIEI